MFLIIDFSCSHHFWSLNCGRFTHEPNYFQQKDMNFHSISFAYKERRSNGSHLHNFVGFGSVSHLEV